MESLSSQDMDEIDPGPGFSIVGNIYAIEQKWENGEKTLFRSEVDFFDSDTKAYEVICRPHSGYR